MIHPTVCYQTTIADTAHARERYAQACEILSEHTRVTGGSYDLAGTLLAMKEIGFYPRMGITMYAGITTVNVEVYDTLEKDDYAVRISIHLRMDTDIPYEVKLRYMRHAFQNLPAPCEP